MAKKAKNRKELLKKPDEFLTFSGKLLATIIKYKVYAVSGLILLLAVVMLISGINYMGNRAENQAFVLLEKGMADYDRILADDGPEKAYQVAKNQFQPLFEEYAQKDAGRLARIVYAGMAYDAGDFDTAITLYQGALDDIGAYPGLKPFILGGLGRTYLAQKAYASAARQFETIIQGSDPVLKEDAYLNLGLIYDRMGKTEKRSEILSRFIAEYPDSTFVGMVKEKLANS
ncbi:MULTISPECIES: tetratricopeptide repeat protein [Desulfococcus]|jgi:tetratricopeptide (TPR) repeat protein|uniref:Tetratricopeptide repeat-containing protein n=1 Tax=Desulfococcus multivorans DSM 2059 TaxID=1121405 RepID=S7V8F8_DESML|nr:tetratricopeptide repeat protein [Desulfococcus multivorans]AOY56913.1 conserved uncharacterized protein [Desulfococcus multivorans]AQU99445.1 hypothetical protein B2D07_00715 [Desulfococcus multivorans]EPR40828.1 Tetratricopeptide repeat-containing protein [Desulfococcus multivorans DSM 2059]MDX9817717.1 tetratricopeptide repeat protein [Desulfococcus multivorans]SKA21083.1 Tetratricopeptide repeat-containing protein [Desulfococcus multivorans DSM 2059]